MKTLGVPDKHRKRVALDTLALTDVGIAVLGGPSREEARAFLRSIGYTEQTLDRIEGKKRP